jgi:hypothetical protein
MTLRHQDLQNDNSRLRKESADLKRQPAARADDMQRLKSAQQSPHELQIKQDAVTNSTREFRRDFYDCEVVTPEAEPSWQLRSVAEIDVTQAAFEKDANQFSQFNRFTRKVDKLQESQGQVSHPRGSAGRTQTPY